MISQMASLLGGRGTDIERDKPCLLDNTGGTVECGRSRPMRSQIPQARGPVQGLVMAASRHDNATIAYDTWMELSVAWTLALPAAKHSL